MTSRPTGNKAVPTTTALQARLLIYQPSQRPRKRAGDWLPTSYGRCRVTGRLGQRHADLVEAVMYCAEAAREVSDGGVELLVDPARIRTTLSDSRYSLSRIQHLFAELRAAVIEIEANGQDERIIGGLVDHVIPSTATRHDPLTGGERPLWRVRLGVALVMLLDRDVKLYRDPAPIARLEHGVSQAVARHVLSHRHAPKGGWMLDTLIRAVAGDLKPAAIRKARSRVRSDAEGLLEIGILVESDRVERATPAR